jgi:hypothetical protein
VSKLFTISDQGLNVWLGNAATDAQGNFAATFLTQQDVAGWQGFSAFVSCFANVSGSPVSVAISARADMTGCSGTGPANSVIQIVAIGQ